MNQDKTILVVDDDQDLRTGLREVLHRQGYRTLEAGDGLAAREMIQGHRPDLVILDMMMPRWGGFPVLEHYRGRADAPAFIMITANEGPRHQAYAEKIGARAYLRKPFPLDELLERVQSVLGAAPAAATTPAATTRTLRCVCPSCGARIKAPIAMLGHKRPCPGCAADLVLRPQLPDDEGPCLVD